MIRAYDYEHSFVLPSLNCTKKILYNHDRGTMLV